ncbi:unnamed protein product [Cunninghamella blakesleeana]
MGAAKKKHNTRKPTTTTTNNKKKSIVLSEEDKAANLELISQQHEIEALQITFYEIESWIEKSAPVLNCMTKELDRASAQFEKRQSSKKQSDTKDNNSTISNTNTNSNNNEHILMDNTNSTITPQSSLSDSGLNTTNTTASYIPSPQTIPNNNNNNHNHSNYDSNLLEAFNPLKWTMSFQPNSSLRLETNIKSVDQLVEAVQKIKLLTDPNHVDNNNTNNHNNHYSINSVDDDDEDNNNNHHNSFQQQDDFYQDESITITANGLVYQSSNNASSYFSSIFNNDDPFSTIIDIPTEYWSNAIERRPIICLEKYKHCNMNLNCLTKDVSPFISQHVCHLYWDCLHPKFSSDRLTFWDRCSDLKRNQVCVDSALAMVFLHGTRHQKDICANATDIAFFYYDRARDGLMDFFDKTHCATLETLMNLSMFCILCKRHSQSRTYISIGLRMMYDMGVHRRASLPQKDILLRKKYLKFFTTVYYNDIQSSLYSGEPAQLNENDCDIDFYEIIELNKKIQELKLASYDDKTIEKETFYVHLMALARIGKKTAQLVNEYQKQFPLPHRVQNDLPYRWAKRVQAMEIELAQWYDKLPDYYRINPQPKSAPINFKQPLSPSSLKNDCSPKPMNADDLRAQSSLLLMLQYQTQWIILHKTFYNNAHSKRNSPTTSSSSVFTPTSPNPPSLLSIIPTQLSPSSLSLNENNNSSNYNNDNDISASIWNTNGTIYQWQRQCTDRSEAISIDAANRIVVIAEIITETYGWCVCQQFASCIYQASTIYCRQIIAANNHHNQQNNNNHIDDAIDSQKQHATAMIQRIVKVLAVSTVNYEGLPNDLTVCLKELLEANGVLTTSLSSLFSPSINKTNEISSNNNSNNNSNPISLNTLSHDKNYENEDEDDAMNIDQDEYIKSENMDYFNKKPSTFPPNACTNLSNTMASNSIPSCLFSSTLSSSLDTTFSLSSSLSSTSSTSSTSSSSTSSSIATSNDITIKEKQQYQHPHQSILDSPLLENKLFSFNDNLPNSPDMYKRCLNQPRIQKTNNIQHRSLLAGQSPTEAMLSIKLKDPVVDEVMAMEKSNESFSNWRQKFSSPYVAIGNQRII